MRVEKGSGYADPLFNRGSEPLQINCPLLLNNLAWLAGMFLVDLMKKEPLLGLGKMEMPNSAAGEVGTELTTPDKLYWEKTG